MKKNMTGDLTLFQPSRHETNVKLDKEFPRISEKQKHCILDQTKWNRNNIKVSQGVVDKVHF